MGSLLVDEEIKSQRLQTLLKTQGVISQEKNKAMVGKKQEVLIERKNQLIGNTAFGRSRGNYLVNIYNSKAKVGEVINVKITGTNKNSLIAEPLSQ